MEKTKKLSVDLRQIIINFYESVNSYSTILNRLVTPRSMVQSTIKKFKQFGMTGDLPGRERQPSRMTQKLL